MLRWAGGHFDPEWFELDLINKDEVRTRKRCRWRWPSRCMKRRVLIMAGSRSSIVAGVI
jgi:hypothetical protein